MGRRPSGGPQLRGSAATTRPVKLYIERLVLEGFPAANRHHISDHVQSELRRLISEGNAIQAVKHPITMERTGAETFRHDASASPQATGRQIAQAIYRSLQGSSAPSNHLARIRPGGSGRGAKR
jgi:hypothetical protein